MTAWEIAAAVCLTALNIAGFTVCAADKRAARLRRQRVPERALFALALAFGAAGVFLAMLLFSHKTKKPKFMVLVPLILVAQVVLLCWIFLKRG
jgi:uncharacterized membrane protein YsdA (DUF1294 family)